MKVYAVIWQDFTEWGVHGTYATLELAQKVFTSPNISGWERIEADTARDDKPTYWRPLGISSSHCIFEFEVVGELGI